MSSEKPVEGDQLDQKPGEKKQEEVKGCLGALYKAFEDRDPTAKRARWLNRMTFILAMVGYCVGLGNFWRFPYLCYKWGGALFFIPYLFCLLTIGLPVTLMELGLGQMFQKGDIGVFRGIHPRLMGVGLASVFSAYAIVAYYNVIIAWALIYFVASFQNPLPWSLKYTTDVAQSIKKCPNLYITEEFFFKDLVKLYKDDCTAIDTSSVIIDESIFGSEVYVATLATWIIVYFCMWKGVNSSSYVVWVTVPLPVLFIFIMVVNNLALPNASDGIKMYIKGYDLDGNPPDVMDKLSNGQMWSEACGQIFFSLGICMGSMTSYGSFNKKHKPIIGDSIQIAFINCGISFFAGFAVFSVVGYLKGIGSPVASKTASIGLAFIAYPAAIEEMPGSNGWSFILSITLFTLGIDSAFSLMEAASTVLQDSKTFEKTPRKLIALILCLAGAFFSLFFSFNWGFTYFDVVDHFLNVYLMLLLGIMECFGAAWVYGVKEFLQQDKIKLPQAAPGSVASVDTPAERTLEEGEKSARRLSVITLFVGYWVPLIILGPVTMWFIQSAWGFVIFWIIQLVMFPISWKVSKMSFSDWFADVFICGPRLLGLAMAKLSREYQGKTEKEGWENFFAYWWGLSLKFFVPFALWFLICLSLKADLDSPYGGYHGFWQLMGWAFPAVGFLMFIIPVFNPPEKDDFTEKELQIFREDWVPNRKKDKKNIFRRGDEPAAIDDEKTAAKEAEMGIVVGEGAQ